MQYLKLLTRGGIWAVLFCLLCIAASVLQGNLLQTNAAVVCITGTFGTAPELTAGLLSIGAAILIFGGRGRIAGFCASMIPFMTLLYLVMGGTAIMRNLDAVPAVLSAVFGDAFSMRALGVGNITGVAAAILLGGPGALFWMWVSALCTMLIKYAEVYLAVKTRQQRGETNRVIYSGGPMRYLLLLPGGGVWAVLFCMLCVAASVLDRKSVG